MQYLFFTIKLYLILKQEKKCVSYIVVSRYYIFYIPTPFFLEKEGEKRKKQEFQAKRGSESGNAISNSMQ